MMLDDAGREAHLAGIPLRRLSDAETEIGGNCYYDG